MERFYENEIYDKELYSLAPCKNLDVMPSIPHEEDIFSFLIIEQIPDESNKIGSIGGKPGAFNGGQLPGEVGQNERVKARLSTEGQRQLGITSPNSLVRVMA